jgi:hypothetical protein
LIEAHNESPAHWAYSGPENTFRGRTDPRKCAAGPDVAAIEQVLELGEQRRLELELKGRR